MCDSPAILAISPSDRRRFLLVAAVPRRAHSSVRAPAPQPQQLQLQLQLPRLPAAHTMDGMADTTFQNATRLLHLLQATRLGKQQCQPSVTHLSSHTGPGVGQRVGCHGGKYQVRSVLRPRACSALAHHVSQLIHLRSKCDTATILLLLLLQGIPLGSPSSSRFGKIIC